MSDLTLFLIGCFLLIIATGNNFFQIICLGFGLYMFHQYGTDTVFHTIHDYVTNFFHSLS